MGDTNENKIYLSLEKLGVATVGTEGTFQYTVKPHLKDAFVHPCNSLRFFMLTTQLASLNKTLHSRCELFLQRKVALIHIRLSTKQRPSSSGVVLYM